MTPTEARNRQPITLEQYAGLPEDERWKVEAVRGRLVREPRPAPLHNRVQTKLIYLLEAYEQDRRTGGVVLSETEFVLSVEPLTVRVPDVAWVSAERIPANGYALPRWQLAPDLAAEVLSPRNRRNELEERVADFLSCGARLVWVVDPRSLTVTAHRPGVEPLRLTVHDELDGGHVLPGFSAAVRVLFPL